MVQKKKDSGESTLRTNLWVTLFLAFNISSYLLGRKKRGGTGEGGREKGGEEKGEGGRGEGEGEDKEKGEEEEFFATTYINC